MKKVAIVTDSTAYIPEKVRQENDIHIVSLAVVFGEEVLKEETEITASTFYARVRDGGKLPSTSQPPIGDFVSLYEKLAETHDEVVVITLSATLSGTYQAAQTAATMVERIKIHVFDSEITSMVQGFYVLEAAEMARHGRNAIDILKRLVDIREKGMRAYFVVDDLSFLHRGGRLNSAQYVVGSLLKIKPILTFKDARIVPYETIRTQKKALKRVKDLFEEDAKTGVQIRAVVIHGNRPDDADKFAKEIRTNYPNVDVYISYFGAVLGTHTGEGALGIGWFKP